MVALFVQTLLLMAAAYLVGAAIACLVRRSLYVAPQPQPAAERRVDPLPEVQRAASAERFARPPEPQPAPPPAVVAPPVRETAPAQDLKRIGLIDADLESALNTQGVRRYEHIAAWTAADVKRIGAALGVGARINRQNWIEQAQVLAKGGETLYALRRARGEAASALPTPDQGERRPLPQAPAPVAVTPRPSTGGAAGVVADVTAPPAPPAPPRAVLVTGPTFDHPPEVSDRAAFASQPVAAETPSMSTAPTAPGPTVPGPTVPSPTVPSSPPPPQPTAAVPIRPTVTAPRDNLQRIGGITGDIEALLLAQGVTRYSQIAHWSPADVERLEKLLDAPGRIGRENWIEQAQILSRGGDTRFSRSYDLGERPQAASVTSTVPSISRPLRLADAIQAAKGVEEATVTVRPARSDLGQLRSVRSEAYQTAEPEATRAPGQAKVLRSAQADDLKRIRGVGVLIERKLNSMGVTAYEQIANWTAADIDRISQSLDFKGRIERENWVEQARILSSGGATEFSRRVDRGELETGRYRR